MELDAATVLEEAADLLLIRGVCRDGSYGVKGRARCTVGAMCEVAGLHPGKASRNDGSPFSKAWRAVWQAMPTHMPTIPFWNDQTADDFEVIDTLRLVAKNLRNEAKP